MEEKRDVKLKKELKDFSEKLQKYKEYLQNSYYSKSTVEELRKELLYKWGKLEGVYIKMGMLFTYQNTDSGSFSNPLFEKALDPEADYNYEALSRAIDISIKAYGKIESPDMKTLDFETKIFHPDIRNSDCFELLNGDHYPQAVELSFKIVRDRLRKITGHEKASDAFGKGGLYINGASASHVDDDFQEGVQFLGMSLDRFRNETVHCADGNVSDIERAKGYINLSNMLMFMLDGAEQKLEKQTKKVEK